MTCGEGVLVGLCVVLALLPRRFDPAIRWKEFNERWRERIERQQRKSYHPETEKRTDGKPPRPPLR